MNKKLIIPLFLCFLVFISCSGEKKDWKMAESENSITACEDFLKQYPQGKFVDKARSKIEAIYFDQAKAANSINAYNDFLKRYPNTNFANEIQELLEEKGTMVELTTMEELFLIEGLSGGISDRCWLAYQAFLENKSKDEYGGSFLLMHKREGFDSGKIKIDYIVGKVGRVSGGTWERKLLRKGQVLNYTEYDVYGRPTTTRMPIETVFIKLKFIVISLSDSQAKVLILPESKIVSKKQ